jgi:hypothetical protein
MKNKYIAPKADVLSLGVDDVIRTSNQAGDNEVPLFPTQNGSIDDLNH